MNPSTFFKCLADDTRLKLVLLITTTNEACVCDLMEALQLDQPKTSRHLAQLRKCGILIDERRGKWVFYKLNPSLPSWANAIIVNTAENNRTYFTDAFERLVASKSSPLLSC